MPERLLTPETSPPHVPTPEKRGAPEHFEVPHETTEHPSSDRSVPAPSPVASPVQPTAPSLDRLLREVEDVLSDGIDDAYAAMDPLTRKEFKEEGERAAQQIQSLLEQAKVKVRAIIKILTRWLAMIPGVSRLFVEQEAKIKADRLLALRRSRSEEDDAA